MTKNYVMCVGVEQEYEVIAVFSDEKTAERFVEVHNRDISNLSLHWAFVKEFELDALVSKVTSTEKAYWFQMRRNGDIGGIPWNYNYEGETKIELEERGYSRVPTHYLQCIIWAEHSKHAIDTANDIRLSLIGADKWPTGSEDV